MTHTLFTRFAVGSREAWVTRRAFRSFRSGRTARTRRTLRAGLAFLAFRSRRSSFALVNPKHLVIFNDRFLFF